jgi:transcription elongation GreA/GreB family factor
MTKHMPELETYVTATAAPVVVERITSIRSYMEREAEYQDLINKQIPANAKKIDEARGYGDLRENFEYQAAKDEQRALLQKQTLMQQDLKDVKAVDFANASTDEVNPGTMVTIVNTAGEEVIYTILGEWDNDLEARIISNKAQLAKNMLGKKVGDKFEMSDAQGVISEATIKAIAGLSPEMVNWVKNS